MRAQLAIIAILICASSAHADPARAKAANTRGYQLHKQKKYKEAGVEYRKAIAEDPAYLLAHYNLACVASLTKDSATALQHLAWVADRASWDPAARSAIEKARSDRDLEWLRKDGPDATMLTSDDTLGEGTLELLSGGGTPELTGKETKDAKLAAAIGSAPGKHSEACSNVAFSAPLDRDGSATVVATLRDGVAVLDAGGKPVTRSEPLGCTGPGERITLLNQTEVTADGFSGTGTLDTHMIVVVYQIKAEQHVAVFTTDARKQLVRAFSAPVLSAAGDGALFQTRVLGNLVYMAPGTQTRRVYRLDRKSYTYVEEK